MSDFIELLLSIEIPVALIILGVFLSAALVFEEYFGIKPQKRGSRAVGNAGQRQNDAKGRR